MAVTKPRNLRQLRSLLKRLGLSICVVVNIVPMERFVTAVITNSKSADQFLKRKVNEKF
jgi:hypothetical protein